MEYRLESRKSKSPSRAAAAPKPPASVAGGASGAGGAGGASGASGASVAEKKATPKGKTYTEQDIQDIISDGYFRVHPDLYDRIPVGSHVRYVRTDTGEGLPMTARFKPGGFVKMRFDRDGVAGLILENSREYRGDKARYVSFSLAYKSIETLWKKYDTSSFIEIHLMYNSLAQKKKQITDLEARVTRLEEILKSLVR